MTDQSPQETPQQFIVQHGKVLQPIPEVCITDVGHTQVAFAISTNIPIANAETIS